jgi:hypothetical protein
VPSDEIDADPSSLQNDTAVADKSPPSWHSSVSVLVAWSGVIVGAQLGYYEGLPRPIARLMSDNFFLLAAVPMNVGRETFSGVLLFVLMSVAFDVATLAVAPLVLWQLVTLLHRGLMAGRDAAPPGMHPVLSMVVLGGTSRVAYEAAARLLSAAVGIDWRRSSWLSLCSVCCGVMTWVGLEASGAVAAALLNNPKRLAAPGSGLLWFRLFVSAVSLGLLHEPALPSCVLRDIATQAAVLWHTFLHGAPPPGSAAARERPDTHTPIWRHRLAKNQLACEALSEGSTFLLAAFAVSHALTLMLRSTDDTDEPAGYERDRFALQLIMLAIALAGTLRFFADVVSGIEGPPLERPWLLPRLLSFAPMLTQMALVAPSPTRTLRLLPLVLSQGPTLAAVVAAASLALHVIIHWSTPLVGNTMRALEFTARTTNRRPGLLRENGASRKPIACAEFNCDDDFEVLVTCLVAAIFWPSDVPP